MDVQQDAGTFVVVADPEEQDGPPPFQPAPAPVWTHHGWDDEDRISSPVASAPVPLVLTGSRLYARPGERLMAGLELIGCTDQATTEARLKQRDSRDPDSLDLPGGDEFIADDEWRQARDREYVAASQAAWQQMTPSDIAREGLSARLSSSSSRSGRRGAAKKGKNGKDGKGGKKKKDPLYPSPNPDELKALRNK